MAFQVYYRKWRPQRFRELVGQEHVSSTLKQAVQQGRVAHSYLLCGPRGTGKTTTARVLAKAVNCLNLQEGDPCNDCARCRALNEARYLDLIELDAASNRGIDEIRNIRDRVNLAPVEGGYKVYIIDEAHMLTEHASNAFLKTLEEPPAHVIFVLCTTEPHKILPTIISRCQRFDFRRLTSDAIIKRLQGICAEEGVVVEVAALRALAHSAGGSLRDAENLMEQLVVSHGDSIGTAEVYDLLGLGQGECALELVRYLLVANAPAALAAINRGSWDGVDVRQLHRQVVELMRGVLMIQFGSRDSVDLPQETVKELEELATRSLGARVMNSLKVLGEVDMRYDASSSLPLELAVVELCMHETDEGASNNPGSTARNSTRPQPSSEPVATQNVARPVPGIPATETEKVGEREAGAEPSSFASVSPSPQAAEAPQARVPSPPPRSQSVQAGDAVPASPDGLRSEGPGQGLESGWGALVKTLSRYKGRRFNIGALLRDCKNQHIEGETLVLEFAHRSHLERMQEEVDDPQGMKTMREAILNALGAAYEVKLTLADGGGAAGGQPSTQSPLVRAALSLGGRIMEEREQR